MVNFNFDWLILIFAILSGSARRSRNRAAPRHTCTAGPSILPPTAFGGGTLDRGSCAESRRGRVAQPKRRIGSGSGRPRSVRGGVVFRNSPKFKKILYKLSVVCLPKAFDFGFPSLSKYQKFLLPRCRRVPATHRNTPNSPVDFVCAPFPSGRMSDVYAESQNAPPRIPRERLSVSHSPESPVPFAVLRKESLQAKKCWAVLSNIEDQKIFEVPPAEPRIFSPRALLFLGRKERGRRKPIFGNYRILLLLSNINYLYSRNSGSD